MLSCSVRMSWKNDLKWFWWFVWDDDSFASWVVNVLLAFVLIKFVVYPGLGLLLGTTHPIVAVVSSSMEQENSFREWWVEECCVDAFCTSKFAQEEVYRAAGISWDTFQSFPFPRGFNKGDIMVLSAAQNLKVGDVLVFAIPSRPDPIIHRIVEKKQNAYKTKGDNNCHSADFEMNISPQQTIGKAVFRVPYLGWLKIAFVWLLEMSGVV